MIGTVGGTTQSLDAFEQEIKTEEDALNRVLSKIQSEIIPALRRCYAGGAADTTIGNLQTAATNTQENVTSVMGQMRNLINERRTELASVVAANETFTF